MNRPALEVADIFRSFGARFVERSRAGIAWPQHKVMRAIERCRTPVSPRNLVGYSVVFDAVAPHQIPAPVWQFRRDRYSRGARIPSLSLNPTDTIP